MTSRKLRVAMMFGLAASAIVTASPTLARRGADDPVGHIRQCRGCDDTNRAADIRQSRGADDTNRAADVRQSRGADDKPGDDRGRVRGRGADDAPGHD